MHGMAGNGDVYLGSRKLEMKEINEKERSPKKSERKRKKSVTSDYRYKKLLLLTFWIHIRPLNSSKRARPEAQ
jgi:hypothetical protein